MRFFSFPITIDEFPASPSPQWRSSWAAEEVFFLTHFHTDHMKGLSSSWSAGIILTSTITKQLLLSKFEGLRGRVLGLPLWVRTPVIATTSLSSLSAVRRADGDNNRSAHSAAAAVFVTLLPAFHIPGSAMVYVECPSGVTYLHTGDFKFSTAAAHSPLRSFFDTHRVDHVFLDDTWLHLGQLNGSAWPAQSAADATALDLPHARAMSGPQVLSKLLNDTQVEEALEAMRRRMDRQRQLFHQHKKQQQQQQQQQQQRPSVEAESLVDLCHEQQPFMLRVYLHNQFGKELLIQQLAERLGTRAVIDDARYARLLAVAEALEEERDDLAAFSHALPQPCDTEATAEETAAPPLSDEERAWRLAGGEAAQHPYDIRYFVSLTDARATAAAAAGSSVPSPFPPPLIEVVGSRSDISPAALHAAAQARHHTPHYGVLISGWARLQPEQHEGSTAGSDGQLWHIPMTLHSTPQEIIDFVALLRPLSVTPLHYRPSRAAVVMQRLGPYLRVPFVNQQNSNSNARNRTGSGGGGGGAFGGLCWTPCIPPHVVCQDHPELCSPTGEALGMTHHAWRHPLRLSLSGGRQDGLDELRERPRLGYHIHPPSETQVPSDVESLEEAQYTDDGVDSHCQDSSTRMADDTPKAESLRGVAVDGSAAGAVSLASQALEEQAVQESDSLTDDSSSAGDRLWKRARVEESASLNDGVGDGKLLTDTLFFASDAVSAVDVRAGAAIGSFLSLSQLADELL